MQSLLNMERHLMTEWSSEHGISLPDSLASIVLIADANDTSSGCIAIEYSFENIGSAQAEIADAEDDAL